MIDFKEVSFRYSQDKKEKASIVKGIDLRIQQGECVLLTGRSGSGKSTLIQMINGIIPHIVEGQLSGRISVNRLDPSRERVQVIGKDVGSVFQNPKSQFFHLNTTDEIAFASMNFNLDKEEVRRRVEQASDYFGVKELLGRNLFNLSGGEKQRIACVSACAHLPKIIVMDEPSSNLDQESIGELRKLIQKLKDDGKTILIAEHRIYYLMDLCDRAILIKDGKVHREFSGDEMKKLRPEELEGLGLRSNKKTEIKLKKKAGEEERVELRVENLTVSYGKKKVLDISHSFPKNSVTAIVGKNGAGKSTFAKALCGLLNAKGQIETDHLLKRKERNKKFFMVMQDVNHQLFAESVLEELLIGKKHSTLDTEQEAVEILRKLNLEAYKDTHPLALSEGQKQRVAIASAVFSGCEYLIFDEPTSGLDYQHMRLFAQLIEDIKTVVKLIIIITHDNELINLCCDDTLEIKEVEF